MVLLFFICSSLTAVRLFGETHLRSDDSRGFPEMHSVYAALTNIIITEKPAELSAGFKRIFSASKSGVSHRRVFRLIPSSGTRSDCGAQRAERYIVCFLLLAAYFCSFYIISFIYHHSGLIGFQTGLLNF